MALSFSFEKVDNYEEVATNPHDETKWHPVADALVWLSMICGYDEITEKNFEKVAARILGFQKMNGAYLRTQTQQIYITERDVARFIGMYTNANTMTDAQWERKLGKMCMSEGKYLDKLDMPSALDIVGLYKKEAV